MKGSKPDLLRDVFGQDFVSNIDNNWPYFTALASPRELEHRKLVKARSASAPCLDLKRKEPIFLSSR